MIDLEKPMHFTKEQSKWIKQYVIIKKQEARADVIYEIKKNLPQAYCNNCNQIACDGGRVGSIQECASVRLLIDTLFELEEEIEEQK